MGKREIIAGILDLERKFNGIMQQQRFPRWMKMGLTAVQFKSLMYIVKTTDANSKKLSDILGVTPANVTGVVDRLIVQGLVRRAENPADRRITLLQPTEKGKKIITNLEENRVGHMTKLLSSLDERELDHLFKGFSALFAAFEKRHK
ncbi:MAG: MarR family transcriptional regulator [Dehalococcoidales bacterium]|nr:MarR family transcriptional regulator [Dehalococcoidales bacterium]